MWRKNDHKSQTWRYFFTKNALFGVQKRRPFFDVFQGGGGGAGRPDGWSDFFFAQQNFENALWRVQKRHLFEVFRRGCCGAGRPAGWPAGCEWLFVWYVRIGKCAWRRYYRFDDLWSLHYSECVLKILLCEKKVTRIHPAGRPREWPVPRPRKGAVFSYQMVFLELI